MTQVFDENNKVVPVTVVKAGPKRRDDDPYPGARRLQRSAARIREISPAR